MRLKVFISTFFLLFLLSDLQPLLAQTNENYELTQTEDELTNDGKKKKKNEDFFKFELDKLNKNFFGRLGVNIITLIILIGFIYYPNYQRKDFLFTFIMFNIVMFFITYFLNKVELSTGAAFGLFAVFSLLRYRTEDISTKDMTYLFAVIAIGLITAVNKGNIYEIAIVNSIILVAAYLIDRDLIIKQEMVKTIQYDSIDNITPDKQPVLVEELKSKTGLNIHKISIGKIDYLRDSVIIKIYYFENKK